MWIQKKKQPDKISDSGKSTGNSTSQGSSWITRSLKPESSDSDFEKEFWSNIDRVGEAVGGYNSVMKRDDFMDRATSGWNQYQDWKKQVQQDKNNTLDMLGNVASQMPAEYAGIALDAMARSQNRLFQKSMSNKPAPGWGGNVRQLYGYLYDTDRDEADAFAARVNDAIAKGADPNSKELLTLTGAGHSSRSGSFAPIGYASSNDEYGRYRKPSIEENPIRGTENVDRLPDIREGGIWNRGYRLLGEEEHTEEKPMTGWDKYWADQEAQSKEATPEQQAMGLANDSMHRDFAGQNGLGLWDQSQIYQSDDSWKKPRQDWQPEDKEVFGKLYLEDPERAEQFAIEANNHYAKMASDGIRADVAQSATSSLLNGSIATIASVATDVLGFGLGDTVSRWMEMAARGQVTEKDYLTAQQMTDTAWNSIAAELNQKSGVINEDVPILGGKGLGDLASLLKSVGESMLLAHGTKAVNLPLMDDGTKLAKAVNMLAPNLTDVIFFGNSAASGFEEAKERGATDDQAMLYATILGINEGLGEHFSIEEFWNIGTPRKMREFLYSIFRQSVVEGSEEGFTSILNNIADHFVMRDKSKFNEYVNEFLDQPDMDEKSAKKAAWKKMGEELAFDIIGGIFTGGVSGGLESGGQWIGRNIERAETGKQIRQSGGAQELIDTVEGSEEYAGDKKIQKAADAAKNLKEGIRGNYALGKLSDVFTEARQATIDNGLKKIFNEAADAMLQEKDLSDPAIAKVLEKAAFGEELTGKEEKLSKAMNADGMLKELFEDGSLMGKFTEYVRSVGKGNRETEDAAQESTGGMESKAEENDSNDSAPEEKPSLTISDDGKTMVTREDGTTVAAEIGEVVSTEDGNVTVAVSGQEAPVSIDKITYSNAGEAAIYQAVSEMKVMPQMANLLISMQKESGDTSGAFAAAIREYYNAGALGVPVENLYKLQTAYGSSLTQLQKETAFDLGRKAYIAEYEDAEKIQPALARAQKAEALKQAAPTAIVDGLKYDGITADTPLNDQQRATVEYMKALAQAGLDVHVFLSKEGDLVQGSYRRSDGSIHIDLAAGNDRNGAMAFALSHEMTHMAEQHSPKAYQEFQDAIFAASGIDVEAAINLKAAEMAARPEYASYSREELLADARSEVVAEACETILTDTDAAQQVLDKLQKKNPSLVERIANWFRDIARKLRDAFAGMDPDSEIAMEFRTTIRQMEELADQWSSMVAGSIENFRAAAEAVLVENAEAIPSEEILTNEVTVTDGAGTQYSIRSMKADIAEGKMFEDLKSIGYTQEQVDQLKKDLEELVSYMTPFRDILDMNEDYGREGRRYSPYKPNSDPLYKISLDFSTLCSKRILTQHVIEQIQLRENRPMTAEEQMAIRAMLNEYRQQEKGLQVACAMCYVEAARLKAPGNMTKWLNDPGFYMRDYFSKNNAAFKNRVEQEQSNFKVSKGYSPNATKKEMSAADVRELNKIGPKLRQEYQPSAQEQAIIDRANSLPRSTFLTAANLANLHESDPEIYKAYTTMIRNATRSKALETDEPYYYGDSSRDNGNGIVVTDAFIKAVNAENGMRYSSWSDWQIKHMLDFITAVIDNSVRGAAMHGYTKYPVEVRVLGHTGMMFNLSGVAGTQTGLNEDGSLSFSPTESVNFEEAMKVREEFPETAGMQCIGVSDEHIRELLRNKDDNGRDVIDYVIPYHTSGLNKDLRRMADIHGWKDYTKTQHAAVDNSIQRPDGMDDSMWHVEPVYSEFFVGYDTGMSGIEAMRASAERYKEMCRERGLTPKFNQFADEDNYWKLLIDRKMINQKTGELIQQKPVKPIFDFKEIRRIVDSFVEDYQVSKGMEDRALQYISDRWDEIPGKIRDLKAKKKAAKAGGSKSMTEVEKVANAVLAARQKGDLNSSRTRTMTEQEQNAKRFADEVQEWYDEGMDEDGVFILGNTGNIIQGLGAVENEIYMEAKKIKKILNDHPEMTIEEIKQIPKILDDPVMILASKAKSAAIVAFGSYKAQNGQPILSALDLKPYERRIAIEDMQKVLSAYTKTSSRDMSAEEVGRQFLESSKVLYADEKRTIPLLRRLGNYTPSGLLRYGFTGSITYDGGNVNVDGVDFSDIIDVVSSSPASNSGTIQDMNSTRSKTQNTVLTEAEMQKADLSVYEKEFIRTVNAYEAETRRDDRTIKNLRNKLTEEVRTHRADNVTWNREFNRLLKEYQAAGEDIRSLETSLKKQKAETERYRQKVKDTRTELTQKARERLEKTTKEFQDARQKALDSRKRTEARHKVIDIVKKLNTLLLEPDKDHHVPKELQSAVAAALDVVNFDTVNAQQRIEDAQKRLAAAKTDKERAEISKTIYRLMDMGGRMDDKLRELSAAYAKIQDADGESNAAYDPVIAEKILDTAAIIGDTPIREMSVSQLDAVYKMYKAVLGRIRSANKAFAQEKAARISDIVDSITGDLADRPDRPKTESQGHKAVDRFFWNNEKPIYAFERIGSEALTNLYKNLRKGEDTWVQDVNEAREFYLQESKKHGYNQWDFDKKYTFTASSGKEFDLNLEQIMSLYAYSRREQARDHIRKGGIVIDQNTEVEQKGLFGRKKKVTVDDATAYNISDATLSEIIDTLTDSQKAFAESMQEYLSKTMGAKGNEISNQLYDIDLFGEEHYWPLKSSRDFMARAKEQSENPNNKIKNAGMTKAVIRHASNPVVLSGFMDTWAGHVNEMSMYHAMTLPMEDFYRVYNWNSGTDELAETQSMQQLLINKVGRGAVEYIDQFLKDLNGGVRADPRETVSKRLTSKFKKAAVFTSASVVIQQPSAIGRAFSIVDPKYFVPRDLNGLKQSQQWEQCKKYAPIAAIKEMGMFDTDMGRSSVDYITAQDYEGFGQKAKAFVTDEGYRDEILGWAPGKADEITWCAIWNACKRQVTAEQKLTGEEMLKAAGDLFTEVITKTQVYDSVFSRSANMRSKSALMGMVTSFMAEPTTSFNMLQKAVQDIRAGDKKQAAKAIASVGVAAIINSLLVSFIYAARDDDDDKTFLEKYSGQFVTGLLDSLNPMTMVPYLRDIWSMMQGYDVERADMSILSDIISNANNLATLAFKDTDSMDEDELTEYYRKLLGAGLKVFDSIMSMNGIPEKNIRREIKAIINMFQKSNWESSSMQTVWNSVWSEVAYSTPLLRNMEKDTKSDQLFNAMMSDDTIWIARAQAAYDTDQKLDAALKKGLRDNDPRIRLAAKALLESNSEERIRITKEIIGEGNFTQDIIIAAINAEANSMKDSGGSAYSLKKTSIYTMDDYARAAAKGTKGLKEMQNDMVKALMENGKSESKAKKSFKSSVVSTIRGLYEDGTFNTDTAIRAMANSGFYDKEEASGKLKEWDFKEEYGFNWSERNEAYLDGDISRAELRTGMINYGKTEEDVENAIMRLDFIRSYPIANNISESAAVGYYTFCDGTDVSREMYYEAWRYYNANKKKVAISEYINGLPISDAGKAAIWKALTPSNWRYNGYMWGYK